MWLPQQQSSFPHTHLDFVLQNAELVLRCFLARVLQIPQTLTPFIRQFIGIQIQIQFQILKMGFLTWYLKMLDVRPITTKSISAGLIYGAADLTAQSVTMRASDSLHLIRTLRMAMFGLLILGPAQHVWFNFLGRILPKRDMITTFKKLIVGQLFYGPSCTAVFFTYNAFLQGESVSEIASRLRRDLLPTLTGGLMYWPICDFFTYKIIPVHLQPLINSAFSFMWTIYLTYMASLEKAIKV